MSALSLSIADRPATDAAPGADFYEQLLDKANTAGREWHGWEGSSIRDFGKVQGTVFLELVPAKRFATLDDLRAFREQQRQSQDGRPIPEGEAA